MKTEGYCCEKNPPSFGVEIMFVVIFPSAFLFGGKSVGSFLKSCKKTLQVVVSRILYIFIHPYLEDFQF